MQLLSFTNAGLGQGILPPTCFNWVLAENTHTQTHTPLNEGEECNCHHVTEIGRERQPKTALPVWLPLNRWVWGIIVQPSYNVRHFESLAIYNHASF